MEGEVTELITRLIFQLALILAGAKVGGEIAERLFKQPAVLGELVAGVALGPFALGGVPLPVVGPVFVSHVPAGAKEVLHSSIAVPSELYFLAQVGAVVLLFVAGLETDLALFLRYGVGAVAVAIGGVALPFGLGVLATVLMGFASSFADPVALFMGAIMTATSVGITARVLSDIKRLDTPEGVTILAAAVIDDVLGILTLTIVASIAAVGAVSLSDIGMTALSAVGIWVAITVGAIVLARPISRFVLSFRSSGASLALLLVVALVVSGLAESFGLAMIIGAYSVGLALSGTDAAHALETQLTAVYHILAPVFFVVIGMMVDVSAMGQSLAFGIVLTLLAIVSKTVGGGLPSLLFGFNWLGAVRIGIGMLPRGEVALIVAGIGLTRGIIGQDLFGVSILMTLVTTMMAPPLLLPAFARGGSGRRARVSVADEENDE
jgi:Kef-type K+ transport system membrane component KefB